MSLAKAVVTNRKLFKRLLGFLYMNRLPRLVPRYVCNLGKIFTALCWVERSCVCLFQVGNESAFSTGLSHRVCVCVCVCIFLSLRDVPSRDDLLKSSDMWVTVAQFYVPGNTWSELSALYEVRMVGLDTAGVGTQPNSCQVFSQCFFLPCFEKCSRGADLSPINIYSFKIEVGERRNGNNLTLLLLLLLFL